MSHTAAHTRSSSRGRRSAVLGLVLAAAVTVSTLGYQSASWLGPSLTEVARGGSTSAGGEDVTRTDGVLPDRVTVFDTRYPGVANLDPDLLRALRQAATAANGRTSSRSTPPGSGPDLYVNSGWRSTRYQAQLLDRAVAEYGSKAEAARWVATPKTSPHVWGEAVDIGPPAATDWLAEHGADFGLCQIYGNEPWHYELRPEAIDHGCPAPYDDPTHDPRMRR